MKPQHCLDSNTGHNKNSNKMTERVRIKNDVVGTIKNQSSKEICTVVVTAAMTIMPTMVNATTTTTMIVTMLTAAVRTMMTQTKHFQNHPIFKKNKLNENNTIKIRYWKDPLMSP